MTNLETKAIALAKTEITQIKGKIPDGIELNHDLTNIKLTDVVVSSNYLHTLFDVGARIDIDMNDDFFIPNE